ncbi:MAG: ribonuclease III [Lentisphaeria bacterium]|nr:ribonuclease III [Lentisphaeria bacterium]
MDLALEKLETYLGHSFADRELLLEALTHPSFAAEHKVPWHHNQRLEFLGDAVLELVLSRMVFDAHPDWQEGDLSKLRAALCRESSLVERASRMNLGEHLRLGKGETKGGGAQRPSNLADAYEAVIGALFLDGGLAAVTTFLTGELMESVRRGQALLSEQNAKGTLQELTQQLYHTLPEYTLLTVDGPDHEPLFKAAVWLRGEQLATATGKTRKAAEKTAAQLALQQVRERDGTRLTCPAD